MTHELKTLPEHFGPVWTEDKKFEIRKDDRGFAIGDNLLLREYKPGKGYTGRFLYVEVIFILHAGFGLRKGFICMTIEHAHPEEVERLPGF